MTGKAQWPTGLKADIQYAVKELARDNADVTEASWIKVKHLLRYLKGTKNYRLNFKQLTSDSKPKFIDVQSDSDWAGCSKTRRSTTGFAIKVSDNLIHSASRTQGSVALSSAEAELYALCSAVMEALFLRNLMTETSLGHSTITVRLLTDSTSAKSIVSRMGPGKRSKHIDLKFLFLQELILDGQVIIQKIPTADNQADLMTKYLTGDVTKRHAHALGVHPHAEVHEVHEC